ncbi:AAA family ATPase [Tenacibaculum finnmarkense]|uniref:AAA family ATPase n=1 Tax=Tenacibaculum finnmarkense TaxID=2781243 RepID=UPI001E3D1051|nr:ATP-binding protein [Tenacibaculum finnmarkense]MCD8446650.1 ATP-binding protein [Tenacibaculum finnmarkense genomovar finnmarkense]
MSIARIEFKDYICKINTNRRLMFLEFKCSNFLSIKDEVILNMTPISSYGEHNDTHIIKESGREDIQLLKSIAVFGSNGGGKSNLIQAMEFMKDLLHNSFKDSLEPKEDRPFWKYHHRLSTETINNPSSFEMSFIIDGIIYKYGFSIQNWIITREYLTKTDKRETILFDRTGSNFKINETSFSEGKRYKDVNSNVLLLNFLAQHNAPESSKIFHWFNIFNIMDGLDDSYVKSHTKELLETDGRFKKWITVALRFLEIKTVSIEDNELVAVHQKYDENNFITGQVSLRVDSEESNGTRKLIYLLGGLYATLKSGTTFIIDEFDSKLHPNLSRKLVQLFHKHNINGAQFIITAHDPTLLDNDIYRRDQIWFIDKDQFGASELYPMSQFKATQGLRGSSDYRKMYLNCHFGAAETMEISSELTNLIR